MFSLIENKMLTILTLILFGIALVRHYGCQPSRIFRDSPEFGCCVPCPERLNSGQANVLNFHCAKSKHGDTFRALARKFNHELVLRTVRVRTGSETTIVLYTVHVRTVNNEKCSLIAVHAHGKQWSTSRYTPCAHAHRT